MSSPLEPDLGPLRPYLVATAPVAARLDLAPRGRPIPLEDRFDPLRRASAPLLRRIEQLDAREHGPAGMAMPRWALYDCAELPGLIAGLGQPDDGGLRPLSMLAAIPTLGDRRWLIYALAAAPEPLRLATLALAIGLIRAREIAATTPWGSLDLLAYARFAPLELRAAWLPAHDVPASCALRFSIDPDRIGEAIVRPGALGSPELLDVGDEAVLQRLQREIEAGRRVRITGAPTREAGALRVPFSIEATA